MREPSGWRKRGSRWRSARVLARRSAFHRALSFVVCSSSAVNLAARRRRPCRLGQASFDVVRVAERAVERPGRVRPLRQDGECEGVGVFVRTERSDEGRCARHRLDRRSSVRSETRAESNRRQMQPVRCSADWPYAASSTQPISHPKNIRDMYPAIAQSEEDAQRLEIRANTPGTLTDVARR